MQTGPGSGTVLGTQTGEKRVKELVWGLGPHGKPPSLQFRAGLARSHSWLEIAPPAGRCPWCQPLPPRTNGTAFPALGAELSQEKQGPRHRAREGLPRRSEEHTSELQSRQYLVCRLLLEKQTDIRSTCCLTYGSAS